MSDWEHHPADAVICPAPTGAAADPGHDVLVGRVRRARGLPPAQQARQRHVGVLQGAASRSRTLNTLCLQDASLLELGRLTAASLKADSQECVSMHDTWVGKQLQTPSIIIMSCSTCQKIAVQWAAQCRLPA